MKGRRPPYRRFATQLVFPGFALTGVASTQGFGGVRETGARPRKRFIIVINKKDCSPLCHEALAASRRYSGRLLPTGPSPGPSLPQPTPAGDEKAKSGGRAERGPSPQQAAPARPRPGLPERCPMIQLTVASPVPHYPSAASPENRHARTLAPPATATTPAPATPARPASLTMPSRKGRE